MEQKQFSLDDTPRVAAELFVNVEENAIYDF
jgi:hypothetical protein